MKMTKHRQRSQNELHKFDMARFVYRQGIHRPLFWFLLRPSPHTPLQTQPPGERALPARRPAASMRKNRLNFKTVSPALSGGIRGPATATLRIHSASLAELRTHA